MPRITSNQRHGQAAQAAANIQREARRIAAERGISEEEATRAVFADAELLKKCHGVPTAEEIAPDWTNPEVKPKA